VQRRFAGRRLRAFCSLTFDDTFVVRDVKLIEGNDGLFLAMPSRKLADHCPAAARRTTCGPGSATSAAAG
jgi:DNA-binding cell septation regulator SpoVG